MAAALDTGRDSLVRQAAQETGATAQWIDFNIDIAKQMLVQAATLCVHLADEEVGHPDGRVSILRRQPVGVVLGFAPWNAPIILATRALAAPLACGNTVVLKASEHCPHTHSLLCALFESAGLPKDVVTVVTSAPQHSLAVAKALIGAPTIRRINFTGSTRVGAMIATEAARVLKRCLLELSGKAPLIVLEDADLDAAAAAAMTGAFVNQGQVCMSTERIVVLDAVADAFMARLVARAARMRAVDPLTQPTEDPAQDGAAQLGRLISVEAAQRVMALVEGAVAQGAVLRLGGTAEGAVMQPTVLDYVAPTMAIYGDEAFGPVACVIRVRDEEEAISVANDTEFGLAAAVFGGDLTRCWAVADRLETGVCQINGPTVFDDPTMPFGGMKASGYGRFGGRAALGEFTEIRWISQHNGLTAQEIENMLNLGRTKHEDEP